MNIDITMIATSNKQSIKEEDLKNRLKWLMIFRVAVMTLLMGASLLFQIGKEKNLLSLYIPSVLLGSIYLFTFLYGILFKKIRHFILFTFIQLFVDILMETVLVMFTGSVESPFSFLYIISIISGALLLGRSGGVFTASLAFMSYGVLVDLEYYQWGWMKYFASPNLSEREVIYSFFLYLVVFFTVAIVSGTLSEKLSRAKDALYEQGKGMLAFRAFHENVVRSIGSGLLTVNLEGRILSFNSSAELITGYSSQEIIGEKWWKVFGWDQSPLEAFKEDEKKWSLRFEKESQKKTGNRLLIGMTLSDLKDDEGEKKGLVATFQDLTKIRQMEETIKMKERLAHLGEMAAGIAHEIRNPLASLSGSMEILSQELVLKDHHHHLMRIALNETERLNHLITDFLNYARPRPPQRKETFLKAFLEEELLFFKNSVNYTKEIILNVENEFSMRPVYLDQDLMKQVFWNLSLNAFEAMNDEGVLKISAHLHPVSGEPKEYHMLFEDNGIGISQESIGKIFNPFYSTKDRGSGLGLSIVHRIVEEHGGKIVVRSFPGKGTCFRIILPLRKEDFSFNPDEHKESVIG